MVEEVLIAKTASSEEQVPAQQKADDAQVETETEPSPAKPAEVEEKIEVVIEHTVATAVVTEFVEHSIPAAVDTKASVDTPTSEGKEPETELKTMEQLFAEVEMSVSHTEREDSPAEEKNKDEAGLEEVTAEADTETLVKEDDGAGEKEESFQDILDLINLPSTPKAPRKVEIEDLEAHVEVEDTDKADDKLEAATSAVVEETLVVETQTEVETTPVKDEPVSEPMLQQVEALVEAAPDTLTIENNEENVEEQDNESPRSEEPQQAMGTADKNTDAAEDASKLAEPVQPEEPEEKEEVPKDVSDTAQKTEESPQPAAEQEDLAQEGSSIVAEAAPAPMTPAQIKALEKEQKAAKKREEKERARREKEEKKRLKEQKKREAKEKKQREKEEKQRKQREAKEKTKAAVSAKLEAKVEEAVVEEAVAASQSVDAEAAPAALEAPAAPVAPDSKPEDAATAEPLDSTSTGEAQHEAQPGATGMPLSSQDIGDEGLLGCSVKEIISSIENNVVQDEKIPDSDSPPEVPETPYPDEEEIVQSTSAAVESVGPPPITEIVAGEEKKQGEGEGEHKADAPEADGDTSLEAQEPAPSSPVSAEISESARSSVLRKIELGPRLRTAILRKSSSGAESEEKRVSLTQPRHVQLSDFTPPVRMPRVRRLADDIRTSQSEDQLNSSTSSCSSPTSPSQRDFDAVIEEQVTVTSASSPSESAPSVSTSSKEKDGTTESGESECDKPETTQQTADAPDGDDTAGFEAVADLSSGPRVSAHADPESPTLVSVASLVLTVDAEAEDSVPPADRPHQPAQDSAPQATEEDTSEEQQDQPDETALRMIAADVVVKVVQKASQEHAGDVAVEVKCEGNDDMAGDEPGLSSTCEDAEVAGDINAKDGEVVGDEGDGEMNSDDEEGDQVSGSRPVVVCSAELVPDTVAPCVVSDSGSVVVVDVLTNQSEDSEAKDCEREESQPQASGDSSQTVAAEEAEQKQTSDGATEITLTVYAGETTETVPEEPTPADAKEDAAEEKEEVEDGEDDSADTSQLQQFNKNYYGIAIVADDADDDGQEKADEVEPSPSVGESNGVTEDSQSAEALSTQPVDSLTAENEEEQVCSSSQQGSDASTEQAGAPSQLLLNGHSKEDRDEVKGEVQVIARCNGSHGPNEDDDDNNETIDAYLKLQGGVIGDKAVIADRLEANSE